MIVVIYLTTSRLIYLLIACVRTGQRFIDASSNIYNENLAKIVGNVNSKLLIILAKMSHLNAGYRLFFCRWMQHNSKNSNGNISLTASKVGIILINHLKFRSTNCLSVIRPPKQLSKVSVRYRSQEYLVRKFSTNYFAKHLKWSLLLVKFHAFTIIL